MTGSAAVGVAHRSETVVDVEQLTRALLAADRREQWLQASAPIPGFAALFIARGGDGSAPLLVGCALVLIAVLVAYVAASREGRALSDRLCAATLAAARAAPSRPATNGERSAAGPGTATGSSVSRLRGVYRVRGGTSTVGGVPVRLADRGWHKLLGQGEVIDVDVFPAVDEDSRADVRRVIVAAFGGRLSADRPWDAPTTRADLTAGYGSLALPRALPVAGGVAAAGPTATRSRGVAVGGVASAALVAALVGTAVVSRGRGQRDASAALHFTPQALAADSTAERMADSIIAPAVRAQVSFESLRVALTPPAYAHDTAFAASVLGEERVLGSGECRTDPSAPNAADELPVVDAELAACVETVLRRDRPVVTHGDSVRDSVRLVVRQRFRRGAHAMIDAALAERHPGPGGVTDEMREIGYDPGPNGLFPGTFDAFRDVYQLPSRARQRQP